MIIDTDKNLIALDSVQPGGSMFIFFTFKWKMAWIDELEASKIVRVKSYSSKGFMEVECLDFYSNEKMTELLVDLIAKNGL
jgi:hypothetical protein